MSARKRETTKRAIIFEVHKRKGKKEPFWKENILLKKKDLIRCFDYFLESF